MTSTRLLIPVTPCLCGGRRRVDKVVLGDENVEGISSSVGKYVPFVGLEVHNAEVDKKLLN
jgi:hypothetical protein